MKQTAVIVVLLLVIGWLLFDRHTDNDKHEALERTTRQKLDSVRAHYRQLIREDSITFIHYQKAKQEANWYRVEATAWQKKYEREKNKPVRRYTDSQLDSIMGAIR
ncbi:MAG: hypothetical protein WAZ98_03835 [Cyclobacteriaceae bacterium]